MEKVITEERFGIITRTPTDLSLIKENPEVILKLLTPIQYEIVKTLYHSITGLTANDIQKYIVQSKLKGSRSLPTHRKRGLLGQTNESLDAIDDMLEEMTFKELLKKSREKVKIPSHSTIIRNLDNLFEQGMVGRRKYPEKKRISYVYFLNPKIYILLKNSKVEI